MKARISLPLILLAFGALAVTGAGCKPRKEPKPAPPAGPPVAVRVQAIESGKHISTEETVGTVRAKLQARIEAKVAGRIQEMRAVPGQAVKAGDLLVRLDAQEVRARLDQALAVSQQAQSDLKRFTALLERAAATQSEFDAVQARASIAEAAVQEASTMLGYAEIIAPFDGVVTRKMADVGDLAAPGKPVVEMEDPAALRVEADVSEALIDRLQPGQTLSVRVPSVASPLVGTVGEIAPTADPISRSFVVKLDLPRTRGLRAGAFARVAIPTGESATLRVPAEAVVQRGQLEYIYVAEANRAQLRLVRTGKRHADEVELLAGATAGERVIVSGADRLRDGQPLIIEP